MARPSRRSRGTASPAAKGATVAQSWGGRKASSVPLAGVCCFRRLIEGTLSSPLAATVSNACDGGTEPFRNESFQVLLERLSGGHCLYCAPLLPERAPP